VQNYSGVLNVSGSASGSFPLTGSGIAAPPPVAPTITVTPSSATGTPCQMFTFTLTTANSGKAPMLTAGCWKIPATTCSIRGATLSVQTTKPSTSTCVALHRSINKYDGADAFGSAGWGIRIPETCSKIIGSRCVLCSVGRMRPRYAGPGPGPVVNPGTPSGTYTIVVSAAGTQTTTTVTLTIQ
jgi:hypothetical protein